MFGGALAVTSHAAHAGVLGTPAAVTLRRLMMGGELALIVHDARFSFHERYRGTQTEARFTCGALTPEECQQKRKEILRHL